MKTKSLLAAVLLPLAMGLCSCSTSTNKATVGSAGLAGKASKASPTADATIASKADTTVAEAKKKAKPRRTTPTNFQNFLQYGLLGPDGHNSAIGQTLMSTTARWQAQQNMQRWSQIRALRRAAY